MPTEQAKSSPSFADREGATQNLKTARLPIKTIRRSPHLCKSPFIATIRIPKSMKQKSRSRLTVLSFKTWAVLLGAAFLLGTRGTTLAQYTAYYYTTQNTATDVWSTGTDWNLVPQSSFPTELVFGPSGTFAGAINNVSTNNIVTTGGGFLVSNIDFQGTGAAGVNDTVTINSGSGEFLNIDSTIPLGNPQINLGANAGSGGGTLTYNIASNITLGSTSGGGLALDITGNGTATFQISGVISGTLGLNKSGSSAIIFSGANSYSGPTSVLGGTLIAGANSLSGMNGALGNGTSAVTVGDVSGTMSASLLTGGAFTVGQNIIVQAGSGGSAILGGNTNDNSFFTGNIALNKNVTLQSFATGSNAVTFNGGGISGAGFGVIKSGSGIVILGGANTYTGATTVNNGTLKAGVAGQAFGVNSAVILANSPGVVLDITGYNNTIGSLSGGGSSGGNVVLGSATLTIGSDNTSTSYAGAISGGGNVIKTGTGTLTLSGASTFGGTASILNGTVQIGATAAAGSSGPLGESVNPVLLGDVSGTNNASLLTGGAFNVGTNINVQAGSTGVATLGGATNNNSSFTGNIVLNKAVAIQSLSTGANAVTFTTGTISGAGAITKTGTGTVVFGGMHQLRHCPYKHQRRRA